MISFWLPRHMAHKMFLQRNKKRQIWFWVQLNIMISIWLCRRSCLFRQLPISRESLELIRVTNVLPTEHAILRQCWACPPGPLTPDRCLQSPDWASSTWWWHLWNFLHISFFPLGWQLSALKDWVKIRSFIFPPASSPPREWLGEGKVSILLKI